MEEKDLFEEMVDELDLNEIDDFEIKPATYQVWMLGYTEAEAITDFEVLVNESKDAERMVEYAKKFVDEKRYESSMPFPPEVAYIEVLVETVVDLGNYESNEGTLFTATVKVK